MDQKDTRRTAGHGAWIPAVPSVVIALAVWGSSRRTDIHMGGGFEGQGEDVSVLWTELPLVLLAAALIPMAFWLLAVRVFRDRVPGGYLPLAAALFAVGVTLLFAVALYSWADQLDPEHVRSLGSHLHL